MRKISKITCMLFGMLIMFSTIGCEKLSDEELLTDHIWRWDKATTNSTNETVLALVALTNALMTGATMEFNQDGTYTVTAMSNPDDGTWEMPDGNTLITDGDQMTIVKLTKSELVLQGEEVDGDYGTYSVTMYWKK
jgi:hypothetical protein